MSDFERDCPATAPEVGDRSSWKLAAHHHVAEERHLPDNLALIRDFVDQALAARPGPVTVPVQAALVTQTRHEHPTPPRIRV
ncbi:hypothetical protein ACIHJG_37235 [Streptomyces sp. NPDC052415]|uniref:hypothetical protein n=1 Tax=Streptomyces sp. NPDC052415 TaxID=3365690 RepID=UPI0037CF5C1E